MNACIHIDDSSKGRSSFVCILVAVGLLTAGFSCGDDGRPSSPEPSGDEAQSESGDEQADDPSPTATEQRLEELDRSIEAQRKRASQSPDSWVQWKPVARGLLARARLSGSYEDYERAEQILQRAFEQAPGESGPHLTAARLNFTLHRFDAASEHLARLEDNPLLGTSERATVVQLNASMALQSGDLDGADEGFRRAHEIKPTVATAGRMAVFAFHTGDRAAADEWFQKADDLVSGADRTTRAWLELQRGVVDLESGDYEAARDHFVAADETMSGWYLIEEHLAETHTLLGDHQKALALYRSIVDRVPDGAFLAALAGVLEELGQVDRAERRRAAAREAFDRRLERFPNAAYGHALGFYLEFGPADRALELAAKNHRLRPGPTASVALAQAQLQAGRVEAAVETLEPTLDSRWNTAPLHATAAFAFERSGAADRAETHRKLARQANPKIFESLAWLEP